MDWYWDGYLRPDMLTLLAGDPKVGKTTLIEGLTRAMARGEDFLGRATSPTTCVVLSEDAAWEYDDREEYLGPAPERTLLTGRRADSPEEWDALIEEARDAAAENGHSVLVVDSLSKLIRMGQRELENDAALVDRYLDPLWIAARQHGLAVIATHHLSRRGRARGSTAFEAVPDAIVTLHRRERATAFDMRARSRTPKTPKHLRGDLLMVGTPWQYVARGDGQGGSSAAVWDVLPPSYEEGATVEELAAWSGATTRTVKNCLLGYSAKDGGRPGWVETGEVERMGAGMAGDPYRYARAR